MSALQQDFYADPALYDILHAPGTGEEVDGLVATADRFVRTGARRRMPVWLEPACGTGRYLVEAGVRGIRGVGCDLSGDMLTYARARARERGVARRCSFRVSDMETMEGLGREMSFDFAFCPINSIRHLASDAAMVRHLSRVRALLRAGGVYAVGISLSRPEWEMPSEDVWDAHRKDTHIKQVVQYEPPTDGSRWERVYSVMHIQRGARGQTVESTYRLRTYTMEQWRGVVAKAGLAVVATVDEMGEDLDAREMGYQVVVLGGERH